MNPVTIQQHQHAGATIAIRSMKACVVYDETSGSIHHHHRVLTLEGGQEPTEQEMAQQALDAFSHSPNAKNPAGRLSVLQVGHDALEAGKRYRVDHAMQALVPL
ncbi:MAG TPA: hypothetical protein VFE79_12850 [Paraburkholderia sp.]|jgi:hypothetical protein|nr:hypothetical protein [Paraburkholderia sp.]